MKRSADLLSEAVGSPKLHKELSAAQSSDELVRAASQAGYHVEKHEISAAMREIAVQELKKRGLPEWAINSMLLGEAVCW